MGLNLYEMDVRSYDPAIARFTTMDPVTHHSMSPFMAFDGNPVYWADPSGADSVGADGLTNDQWMELSRPGGGGFDAMRGQAKANNEFLREQEKSASVIIGELEQGKAESEDEDDVDDNTDPFSIFFYTIGGKNGVSQTAAISGIDKVLYDLDLDGLDVAYFTTIVPLYFNLPTLTRDSRIDKAFAASITARAIDYALDMMQERYSINEYFDKAKEDIQFRKDINSYMRAFGGSVSTTPTNGFKGTITIHKDIGF